MHLKGEIESIRETSYKAVSKKGVVQKGAKKWPGYESGLSSGRNSFSAFNAEGNMEKYMQFNDDGTIYSRQTYQREKYKTVINDTFFLTSKREPFLVNYCYTSLFDTSGKITEGVFFSAKNYSRYTYYYGQNGWLDSVNTYDSTKIIAKEFYRYDALGHVISQEWKSTRDDFSWMYKFDSAGNPVEWTWYEKNKITSRFEYKYDDDHNLVEVRSYKKESTKADNTYTFTYEFDAQRNWTKKVEYKNGKAQYVFEREITYY